MINAFNGSVVVRPVILCDDSVVMQVVLWATGQVWTAVAGIGSNSSHSK